MIRTLRAHFLKLLFREKLLLAGLVIAVAAIWSSSLSGRAGRVVRAVRSTSATLRDQQHWLANGPSIEAQARASASRLDAVKTLDGIRLLAEVNAIANDAGLKNYTSGESKDVSSGQFAVHTLQYNISKVDWATLKQFYLALGKRSPYIGIESYSMQVDRANPSLLNAFFQISSVEISSK
jgi:hypothetical protein